MLNLSEIKIYLSFLYFKTEATHFSRTLFSYVGSQRVVILKFYQFTYQTVLSNMGPGVA
jgi:hypothetical protein